MCKTIICSSVKMNKSHNVSLIWLTVVLFCAFLHRVTNAESRYSGLRGCCVMLSTEDSNIDQLEGANPNSIIIGVVKINCWFSDERWDFDIKRVHLHYPCDI